MSYKIAIVSNTSWNLYNFRRNLAYALKEHGYEVVMVAPYDKYSELLKKDFAYHDVAINNKGRNPLEDLKTIFHFFQVYKEIKPDVILSFTIKPNIYGTIAATFLNIKAVNNISGLGTLFITRNIFTKLAKKMYKFSHRHASKIFFQNRDDYDFFIEKRLIDSSQAEILPGSGIDTERFKPIPYQKGDEVFRFLLIARLLKDKGVFEYVDAARKLKKKYKFLEFQLLGSLDASNLTAISREAVERWEEEEIVTYLGHTDDVRPFIANVDCVVLPSYREGTPRTLLEAASMAKPIVTTDTVGCRDVVEDGKTGFLCHVRDAKDLADKLEKMLHLSDEEREKMGELGRQKMIKEYDEKIVIDRYLSTIDILLGQSAQ